MPVTENAARPSTKAALTVTRLMEFSLPFRCQDHKKRASRRVSLPTETIAHFKHDTRLLHCKISVRSMSARGLGSVKTIFEVVWRNINVSKRPETHVKFS